MRGRVKSNNSHNKGIRIRLTQNEYDHLDYIQKYFPGKSKSDIIRNWIEIEYKKHAKIE